MNFLHNLKNSRVCNNITTNIQVSKQSKNYTGKFHWTLRETTWTLTCESGTHTHSGDLTSASILNQSENYISHALLLYHVFSTMPNMESISTSLIDDDDDNQQNKNIDNSNNDNNNNNSNNNISVDLQIIEPVVSSTSSSNDNEANFRSYPVIIRDAADQEFNSNFPAGFRFYAMYDGFVRLFRGELSNIITACYEYHEYSELIPLFGDKILSIFGFANEFVRKYQLRKLQSLKDSLKISDNDQLALWGNGNINRAILSRFQNEFYDQFLVELKCIDISIFPSDIREFHEKLLHMYAYEQSLSNQSLILEDSLIDIMVTYMFKEFAHYLWIARFSNPPCMFNPLPGQVGVDVMILCEDVMGMVRKNNAKREEIVLLPALYFCHDRASTVNAARLVRQGVSLYCSAEELEAINWENGLSKMMNTWMTVFVSKLKFGL